MNATISSSLHPPNLKLLDMESFRHRRGFYVEFNGLVSVSLIQQNLDRPFISDSATLLVSDGQQTVGIIYTTKRDQTLSISVTSICNECIQLPNFGEHARIIKCRVHSNWTEDGIDADRYLSDKLDYVLTLL